MNPRKDHGIWETLYSHLSSRIMFAEDLIPAFLCSIGGHIANLHQAKEPFFFVNRHPSDLRLCVTVVAPSGFSKSYTMKCFVGRYGIVPQDSIRSTFRGKLTEAGFIGSINGEGEPVYGDAYDYSDGILAFNEITNVFLAGGHEHSSEMINQVMDALSEGRVSKRLARGLIDYPTHVTMWGGVQPRRFDFSQGLSRRFMFVSRDWKSADVGKLKDLCFKNLEGMSNDSEKKEFVNEVEDCRDKIRDLQTGFRIETMSFDKDLSDFIKKISSTHLDASLFQRAVIGRAVFDCYRDTEVVIKSTPEIKTMITTFSQMLQRVAEGSDLSTLKTELKQLGGMASRKELFERFQRYSYNIDTFTELVDRALKTKMIHMSTVTAKAPTGALFKKRVLVLSELGGGEVSEELGKGKKEDIKVERDDEHEIEESEPVEENFPLERVGRSGGE